MTIILGDHSGVRTSLASVWIADGRGRMGSPGSPERRPARRRVPLRFGVAILGFLAAVMFYLQARSLSSMAPYYDGMDNSEGNNIINNNNNSSPITLITTTIDDERRRKGIEAQVREQLLSKKETPVPVTTTKKKKKKAKITENNTTISMIAKVTRKKKKRRKRRKAPIDELSFHGITKPEDNGTIFNAELAARMADFPEGNLTKLDYFGACLLIKDDNHWLIEWIAFHYHVLPLRYLIVAIDPDSKTSPRKILERWKRSQLMTIKVWNDQVFMPETIPKSMLKAYVNNTHLMKHRHRQNSFHITCMRHLKFRGVPWVQMTDTDEFTAINYASGHFYNLTKLHPIQQPGSVLRVLNLHQKVTGIVPKCIYMPRYMFGSTDNPRKSLIERNVPPNSTIKGVNFLTQRFMFRDPKSMTNGKNLVHLAATEKIKGLRNVHRVSSECPSGESLEGVDHVKSTLVRVHHYMGTLDQFLFRQDPRANGTNIVLARDGRSLYNVRGVERFQELSAEAVYLDSGARGWIAGFVKDVGVPMAEHLLLGIGQVGVE
jgi:hypothetical protein